MNSADPVAEQYARYAYPEPGDDIPTWLRSFNYDPYDPSQYSTLFWPEGRPKTKLKILVAGCGTMEAAVLAFKNPKCSVTGVDFSELSIAHEERLRERHKLENLTLRVMDLLDVPTLEQHFDLIVCTGVLHHLRDPAAGLRALASVLDPSCGAMVLMLYGRLARAGIYALQDAFRRMGIPQSPEGVAAVRSILGRLPPHHLGRWYFKTSSEMNSDAAIVDTFLHRQDVAYSVADVLAFVESNGLRFQDWLDRGTYNQDWPSVDPNIPERDRWSINEDFSTSISTHSPLAMPPSPMALPLSSLISIPLS